MKEIENDKMKGKWNWTMGGGEGKIGSRAVGQKGEASVHWATCTRERKKEIARL